MSVNFSEFQVLFRTLGKKRINMAELVDQIENKLKEIMLKRGITPANRSEAELNDLGNISKLDNKRS